MRLFVGALLAVLLGGCTSVPSAVPSARDQVAAAIRAWQAAYDSRDPKAIVALYDPEAVLWGTAAKTIAPTPEAVRDYFKNAAARPNARVVLGDQHIRVYGDTAFNSGSYTFSDLRDGQVVPRPARFTFVYHRRAGRWMVVAHHSSAMP
jgi:uncharacterized protein (TIGR02246 family)